MVAVFQQIPRDITAARTQIDSEHRLQPGSPTPIDEFVGAEGVRFGWHPLQFQPQGPLLQRTDPVIPVVAADKIAAGVADDGWG
jgi:hypothetical protein